MLTMNIIQLSPHVYKCVFSINVSVEIPVNVWLVKDGEDVYIIDTGVESHVDEQIKAAESLGKPKAILLTHGHSDHIKGAGEWLKAYDLPIYAHEVELPFINGEKPYPNKQAPEQNAVAGIVKALTDEILATLPVSAYLTPGHAPGHVVYYHEEDKVLMTGDLFITSREDLHPPIRKFSVDMNENIDSGAIVDDLKPALISSSHGEELEYHGELYKKYVLRYRD